MWFSRKKHFSKELEDVARQADATAVEVIAVKKRQDDIERRVNYLNQELQVQLRNSK